MTNKPASPAAVAHRAMRVAQAVDALLQALDTGATLTGDDALMIHNAAGLLQRRADAARQVVAA